MIRACEHYIRIYLKASEQDIFASSTAVKINQSDFFQMLYVSTVVEIVFQMKTFKNLAYLSFRFRLFALSPSFVYMYNITLYLLNN